MNTNKKYAVLADIESVRVPYASFEKALTELSKQGEIATCKFYGYSAKRTKDYKEFIAENYYEAKPVLKKKRKGKLDLRQVIDAVTIANGRNIDGFFLMYGNGDIQPLISWLRASGYEVIAGVLNPDANSELCNKVVMLDTLSATNNTTGFKQVKAEPAVKKIKPVVAAVEADEDMDLVAELEDLLR